VLVNGKKVNIPSFRLVWATKLASGTYEEERPGDWRPGNGGGRGTPHWLELRCCKCLGES
jgi:hypothetical protein